MKKQFLHEAHSRNDKALKADYREELVQHPSQVKSWTGKRPQSDITALRYERARRNAEQKEALLKEAHEWFFVYDRWLFRYSTKLSYFACLNANHAHSDDPELESAFKRCRKNWGRDLPRILAAIKKAVFVRTRFGWDRIVWHLPQKLIADELSAKMPSRFRPKLAKVNRHASTQVE